MKTFRKLFETFYPTAMWGLAVAGSVLIEDLPPGMILLLLLVGGLYGGQVKKDKG